MASDVAEPAHGPGTGGLAPEFDLVVAGPPPGVAVESRPLVRLPVDQGAWAQRVLAPDTTAGVSGELTLEIHDTRSLRTDEGWPLSIVRSDLVGPSGVVEQRLHGLYAIDCLGAVVVARGDVDGQRESLEDLLRTARARHRPRVVAIAQVWQGFADEDSQ